MLVTSAAGLTSHLSGCSVSTVSWRSHILRLDVLNIVVICRPYIRDAGVGHAIRCGLIYSCPTSLRPSISSIASPSAMATDAPTNDPHVPQRSGGVSQTASSARSRPSGAQSQNVQDAHQALDQAADRILGAMKSQLEENKVPGIIKVLERVCKRQPRITCQCV